MDELTGTVADLTETVDEPAGTGAEATGIERPRTASQAADTSTVAAFAGAMAGPYSAPLAWPLRNANLIVELAPRSGYQGVAVRPSGVSILFPPMKQGIVTANYPMSQGDFILACHTKADFMERDAVAFTTRGVNQARFDAFNEQTQVCAKLPSDQQLDFEKQGFTDAALKQRGVVESGMATVMSQVAIVHDNRSPAYKAFGSAGLYDASEGDFYVNMGHLLDWATAHVTEYKTQGLSPAQLAELTAENEKYLAALKLQRLAISTRSATTQTRQITLNAHYDELSALCGIGQGLFKQTDVSKYDDYVIDPTEHSDGPATPPAE